MKHNKELLLVAAPFIKILYDFLKESEFLIMLTDECGCILNILGDKEMLKQAKETGMVIGAFMNEENVGTNAMGTAIRENMPIQISAKEHFIKAFQNLTCSAAPIHDNKGNIIGTLNLTGSCSKVHPHTLGLAVAAVKSIENDLNKKNAENQLLQSYSYMNTIMDAIYSAIIAIDINGKIDRINKFACKILKTTEEELKGRYIYNIINCWNDVINTFEEGKFFEDRETDFLINGRMIRYNLSAHAIRDGGKVIGVVLVVKELQKVINLINKYTGMRARYTFSDIVTVNSEMKKIIEIGKSICDSPSTVLIQGESGTGKEIIAQAIHNESSRRDYGFVAINCGALSKNLIESELFGYDDGAFTGAKKGGNPGKFELANGGTLFLDEIGEMPLEMQVNLLRVIQEGSVTRIGGKRYIPVDVRIIAATNRDLKKEVEMGNFREDLYYRLSVIPIKLPPLRERTEDIPYLIKYFLKSKCEKLSKPLVTIDEDTMIELINYSWPGNIRELENYTEKIVNINSKLQAMNDEFNKVEYIHINSTNKKEDILSLNEICSLEEMERKMIKACIEKYNGNISKISKILGISRNTLYVKMKKYNIK